MNYAPYHVVAIPTNGDPAKPICAFATREYAQMEIKALENQADASEYHYVVRYQMQK